MNKDLQVYIGVSGESIWCPNRGAAEIDVYGGIRPPFGMFAFDFGVWGYLYPGGQCFNSAAFPGSGIPGSEIGCIINGNLPFNGNVAKKDASFFEGYAKVNVTLNDHWQVGANEYYSPHFLNLGTWGDYPTVTPKRPSPDPIFCPIASPTFISL